MRIATVWRDEMYDVINGSNWSRKAPSYGLFGVHNDISVFIHLPDGYPVRDDRYRERLLHKRDSEPLKCEDFICHLGHSRWPTRTSAFESQMGCSIAQSVSQLMAKRGHSRFRKKVGLQIEEKALVHCAAVREL